MENGKTCKRRSRGQQGGLDISGGESGGGADFDAIGMSSQAHEHRPNRT